MAPDAAELLHRNAIRLDSVNDCRLSVKDLEFCGASIRLPAMRGIIQQLSLEMPAAVL
jgi:hypothetical protein